MQAVGNIVNDDNGNTVAVVMTGSKDVRPDLVARQFADSGDAFKYLRKLFDAYVCGKNSKDEGDISLLLQRNGY